MTRSSSGAHRLAAKRHALGLSQQDLAEAAGVSLSLIAQFEQGKHKNLTVSTARKMAGALEMDLGAFLQELK